MKKCSKCMIEFNGNLKICPLCQSELYGNNTNSVFPKLNYKKNKLLYKILLFVSFCIGILFAFIEYNMHSSLYITKYVIFGLITNYVLIKFIHNNYKNVLKMMNGYFFVLIILFLLWFWITKSLIITTYLVPVLCIIIFIFNSITLLVLKDFYLIKFVKTILSDCLVGLIPLLLVYFKLTTFDLLSYICVLLDIIVFIGLLIFCKDNVIEEIKKIFNF